MTINADPRAPLGASEANLVGHLRSFPSHVPGTTVIRGPDLTIVDSGFPSDMLNVVCGARLAPAEADDRIAAALAHFRTTGRPFSWWVGPDPRPADLDGRLTTQGLALAETHVAMQADLASLPDASTSPEGLVIRRVSSPTQLLDFAAVVAAIFRPPDLGVIPFYQRAATVHQAPDSRTRHYVGYLDNRAVATSEGFFEDGVVGVYAVVTAEDARRRGIGTAMTLVPLLTARAEGYGTGVLQASPEGHDVYARLGFRPHGTFREYKPTTG